jgi:hypothetical protein
VPYTRFQEQSHARKAAEEKLKALAWAEGLDQQLMLDTVNWRTRAHRDPSGFVQEIFRTASPQVQEQLRGVIASLVGAPPAAAATQDREPQPDVVTDTGTPVYSAKQQALWYDWQRRQMMAEVQKQLAPLQNEVKRSQQLRDRVIAEHKTRTFASTTAKSAESWPHFKENVKPIVEELQKLPPGETEAAEELNLYKAYMTVYTRDVLPGLSGKAEAAVLADLKTKAVAGSEHPGRTGTTEPQKFKSMRESLAFHLKQAGVR